MLREEWGFGGFVISDCGALQNQNMEAYLYHNFSNRSDMKAAVPLNAGCDTGL